MPGETGVTVVTTLVCFVFYCMRGCGRIVRPAFPAPSDFFRGRSSKQNSRKTRGEIAKLCLGAMLFESRIPVAVITRESG
jgi:hypothetical protein